MPRLLVWTLYGCLVLVWSSTWVVIAVGLDGVAPFLGAGIRFALAGLGVLAAARALGRCAPTCGFPRWSARSRSPRPTG